MCGWHSIAVTNCQQLWELLQLLTALTTLTFFASSITCYKLLWQLLQLLGLTVLPRWRHLWQLLQARYSFGSKSKLSTALKVVTIGGHSSHMQSTALITETSCQQFSLLKTRFDNVSKVKYKTRPLVLFSDQTTNIFIQGGFFWLVHPKNDPDPDP